MSGLVPDPPDAPIEPMAFLGGVKVVDIGDLRVARGLSRRPYSACRHHKLNYDSAERRVWCADCERNVDGFDAFKILVESFDYALKRLDERETKLTEATTFSLRSLAARELDKAWQRRGSVPACPHCHHGLFPEDFKNGVGTVLGRDYAEARRKKAETK